MARAVGEAPFASKVINGLLAVGHGVERVGRAGRLEGAFKKEDIVFFVFRVEDAGAGVAVLQPEAATLRTAIERVLNDSSLRAGAGRIADEMSTMASMDDAAEALLALAHAGTG